jgi:hypothetical protein
MSEFISSTTYFDKPGKANTARTLQLAVERAAQLNINTILVATTFGESGKLTAQAFQGKKSDRCQPCVWLQRSQHSGIDPREPRRD